MIKDLSNVFQWFFVLAKKLFGFSPVTTITIVVMTLAIQVLNLASLFIPIKIVMLLGVEEFSNPFPWLGEKLPKDKVIIGLSVVTVAFFLLQNYMEKWVKLITTSGAKKILRESHKLIIFENQDEIAADAYKNISEAIASACFIIIVFVVIMNQYRDAGFVLFSYIIGSVVTLEIISKKNKTIADKIKNNGLKIVNNVSLFSFMVIFLYVIYDFLYEIHPEFYIAIITLILVRQLNVRSGIFSRSLYFINRQKQKIKSLIFHGHVFNPNFVERKTDEVWDLMRSSRKEDWQCYIFVDLLNLKNNIKTQWRESGVPNVLIFEGYDRKNEGLFVIKFFDKRKTANALHEAALLMDPPENLSAPELILTTEYHGYQCHVFHAKKYSFLETKNKNGIEEYLRKNMLAIELDESLICQYKRTSPLIYQRLSSMLFERVELGAKEENLEDVNLFLSKMDYVRNVLAQLTVVVVNDFTNMNVVIGNEYDNYKYLHWGEWKIEPIGFGWEKEKIDILYSLMGEVGDKRKEFKKIERDQICLSVLMSILERHINAQRYQLCVDIIKEINVVVRALEHEEI